MVQNVCLGHSFLDSVRVGNKSKVSLFLFQPENHKVFLINPIIHNSSKGVGPGGIPVKVSTNNNFLCRVVVNEL